MPLLRVGRRARRTLLVALVLLPVLALAGLVATARLFVWPETDRIERADAVVVLAGGDGERLDRGLQLMRDGVAPTLVLSFGPNRLCSGGQPFAVVCFAPSPETTRGEAEAIG
ncbi:MAG: YdcF family protein, partial [Acidimicrobiia bacterium]